MPKKSGKFHMCIDNCALNVNTNIDNYPILHIDDMLNQLEESTVYY